MLERAHPPAHLAWPLLVSPDGEGGWERAEGSPGGSLANVANGARWRRLGRSRKDDQRRRVQAEGRRGRRGCCRHDGQRPRQGPVSLGRREGGSGMLRVGFDRGQSSEGETGRRAQSRAGRHGGGRGSSARRRGGRARSRETTRGARRGSARGPVLAAEARFVPAGTGSGWWGGQRAGRRAVLPALRVLVGRPGEERRHPPGRAFARLPPSQWGSRRGSCGCGRGAKGAKDDGGTQEVGAPGMSMTRPVNTRIGES